MKPEKKRQYALFTTMLADDAEANFGELNIVRMARTLVAPILASDESLLS